MSYATRADLEARFGALEIARLADADTAGGEAGDAARIDAARADAAAEIDAALSPAFEWPLVGGPWPALTAIACDLARARLYDDDPPKRVLGNAHRARRTLEQLADGRLRLVDASGAEAVRRRAMGARTTGPAPVFTRAQLQET